MAVSSFPGCKVLTHLLGLDSNQGRQEIGKENRAKIYKSNPKIPSAISILPIPFTAANSFSMTFYNFRSAFSVYFNLI